jgi:hypothetical protein
MQKFWSKHWFLRKRQFFFAENWEKSQKIVIITSTPGDWICSTLIFFISERSPDQEDYDDNEGSEVEARTPDSDSPEFISTNQESIWFNSISAEKLTNL